MRVHMMYMGCICGIVCIWKSEDKSVGLVLSSHPHMDPGVEVRSPALQDKCH